MKSSTINNSKKNIRWIQSVLYQIEHYKAEHHNLLKEAVTILDLALWEANIEREDGEGITVKLEVLAAVAIFIIFNNHWHSHFNTVVSYTPLCYFVI